MACDGRLGDVVYFRGSHDGESVGAEDLQSTTATDVVVDGCEQEQLQCHHRFSTYCRNQFRFGVIVNQHIEAGA